MKKCNFCGQMLDDDAKYCEFCGSSQARNVEAEEVLERAKDPSVKSDEPKAPENAPVYTDYPKDENINTFGNASGSYTYNNANQGYNQNQGYNPNVRYNNGYNNALRPKRKGYGCLIAILVVMGIFFAFAMIGAFVENFGKSYSYSYTISDDTGEYAAMKSYIDAISELSAEDYVEICYADGDVMDAVEAFFEANYDQTPQEYYEEAFTEYSEFKYAKLSITEDYGEYDSDELADFVEYMEDFWEGDVSDITTAKSIKLYYEYKLEGDTDWYYTEEDYILYKVDGKWYVCD